MKVYNAFASREVKSAYICKSEITKDLLLRLNLPKYITVQYAKNVFDDINNYVLVFTGSSKDNKRRRRTKYVLKRVFYDELVKGLHHF